MNQILKKLFKRNKVEEEVKKVDIESIFKSTHDIDKFIDEYRELIIWINNKYPSFKHQIKNDYWIQRIIKEHDEILMDLRKMIRGDIKESEYLLHNKEKVNKILNSNIKNLPKIHDPFIYSVGLSYLWKFIERYPDKLNFLDKDVINEIISTDYYLSCLKEPFLYVNDGISRIILEFKIYKNISDDNELDINEVINFAEELVHTV